MTKDIILGVLTLCSCAITIYGFMGIVEVLK